MVISAAWIDARFEFLTQLLKMSKILQSYCLTPNVKCLNLWVIFSCG